MSAPHGGGVIHRVHAELVPHRRELQLSDPSARSLDSLAGVHETCANQEV